MTTIKEFWDNRARQFGADQRATLCEVDLRELEINSISKYLSNGMKVLDVGCGNGYSTLAFAKQKRIDITGIDYSEIMISHAIHNLELFEKDNIIESKVSFRQQDVLKMDLPDDYFDVIISERCLQNLSSWEDQCRAILNIADKLKPSGLFVMLECSLASLDHLIRFLNFFGKKEPNGVMPWHNTFFCDALLVNTPVIRKRLVFLKIVNFASTYTLITRLFPSNAFLRKYSKKLPNIGSYGYNKIFLWRKRA